MSEFQEVIEQLIELFKEMIPVENDKLHAARHNKITFIEDCMTREQSFILRLKGLEKERERVQQEIGFAGLSFREILEAVPKQEGELLLPLFDELSRQIQMFQEVNEDASLMIEMNLRQITKAVNAKEGGIYRQDGSETNQEQHFTNRRI